MYIVHVHGLGLYSAPQAGVGGTSAVYSMKAVITTFKHADELRQYEAAWPGIPFMASARAVDRRAK